MVLPGVARARLAAVSSILFDHGAQGVQEEDPPDARRAPRQPWDTGPEAPAPPTAWLTAWFDGLDDDAQRALAAALAEAGHAGELRVDAVPDEDWEHGWRRHFPVVALTPRTRVVPPWEPAAPGDLVIEPGQGFGTGQHVTTRQAATLLEPLLADAGTRATTVLDVGCGSGVLALLAARHGADAQGVDISPEAIENARDNAARNGLSVPFSTDDLDDLGPHDIVVANIHAEVLSALAPALWARAGRHLVLAGILADREQAVAAAFAPLHAASMHRVVEGEWVAWRLDRAPGADA